MSTFRVIFSQVNQVAIEVEADDQAEADDKASRIWRREYGKPDAIAMQITGRKAAAEGES